MVYKLCKRGVNLVKMFFIVGIITVFSSVLLGHIISGGSLGVLFQPHGLFIIFGTAAGSIIIGYPMSCIKQTLKSIGYFFKGTPYSKQDYMELLLFSFNSFRIIKIKGMLEIERHIDNSHDSNLFQLAPSLRQCTFSCNFIIDNFRLITMGMDNPYQFEDIADRESDLYRENVTTPGNIFANLGDSLPALGIVAAVLGLLLL